MINHAKSIKEVSVDNIYEVSEEGSRSCSNEQHFEPNVDKKDPVLIALLT